MKRLLLLSILLLLLSSWNLKAQNENGSFLLTAGEWVFEKAEYMELSPSSQKYQVKHDINSEEGLYAYSACLQEVVKKAVFLNGEEALIETLFDSSLGKYSFIMPPSSENKQSLMQFGGIEDMGKESTILGRKYNAHGVMYKVEYIDENTIGIILEKGCSDENFVVTQAAVKCILKKQK